MILIIEIFIDFSFSLGPFRYESDSFVTHSPWSIVTGDGPLEIAKCTWRSTETSPSVSEFAIERREVHTQWGRSEVDVEKLQNGEGEGESVEVFYVVVVFRECY